MARIGFDWLHLAALGDQPMQQIRLASSTELIDLGANENPNAYLLDCLLRSCQHALSASAPYASSLRAPGRPGWIDFVASECPNDCPNDTIAKKLTFDLLIDDAASMLPASCTLEHSSCLTFCHSIMTVSGSAQLSLVRLSRLGLARPDSDWFG